nr:hypothetical transcript [Hymenolepis microstoma]
MQSYPRDGGEMYIYRNGIRLNKKGVPFKNLPPIIVLIMAYLAKKRAKPLPYFASKFSANIFAEYVKNHTGTPCIAFV